MLENDEDEFDEGPSEDDRSRLDHDRGYCPECGAEVWDNTEVCPQCGLNVGGRIGGRKPVERWFRRRWTAAVVILVLIVFTMTFVLRCQP